MKRSTQTLRPYQQEAVDVSWDHVLTALQDATAPRRKLLVAPMGTGKGTMQLAIRDKIRGSLICTPSLEVIRGFLERLEIEYKSQADMIRLAEEQGIWTPTRLHNRILQGEMTTPDCLIVDEAHHAVESNKVSATLFALMGLMPCIGFTATPYRGTPRGTIELREVWGLPHTLLTWEQAVTQGYCTMPRFSVYPLLDDDVVEIRNGQFVASSVESEAADRFEHLMQLVQHVAQDGKPTMLALPSTELVNKAVEAGCVGVTQATSFADRTKAFEACKSGEKVLAQIAVVGEGVDLPWLHRIVDAKPTLSPVAWFQMIGRATRPGERPEVIVTNRNLERHGYLFDGMLPPRAIGESQEAFGGASERASVARHIGLEAVGRFKPLKVKAQHYQCTAYMLAAMEGDTLVEWAVICKPSGEPIVARKASPKDGDTRQWGKWTRAEMPSDFQGFQTSKRRYSLSDKQRKWWERAASRHGLDLAIPKAARDFQVLPVLADLGERL